MLALASSLPWLDFLVFFLSRKRAGASGGLRGSESAQRLPQFPSQWWEFGAHGPHVRGLLGWQWWASFSPPTHPRPSQPCLSVLSRLFFQIMAEKKFKSQPWRRQLQTYWARTLDENFRIKFSSCSLLLRSLVWPEAGCGQLLLCWHSTFWIPSGNEPTWPGASFPRFTLIERNSPPSVLIIYSELF